MKRIYALAVFLVVFLSAALPAGGSAEKDEALYPICEDGLWGYMNRGGETVITPGWRMAYPFRNGLAQVKLTEDGRTKALIDRKGEYVSGPGELFYDEYDHAVRVAAYDGGGEGYIDRDSGFYLPPDPDIGMVILWDDDGTGPIAAQNRNGLTGYLDRASGEPVIPFRFTGEADDISFHDGFALAADEIRIEDAAGHVMALGTHRILIDPDGREITFANGITPISAVYDGIFVFSAKVPAPRGVPDGVSEEEEEEEEEYNPEDDSRDGSLALGNGERIVFPLYSLNRLTGERVELPDGDAFLHGEDGMTVGYGIAKTDGTILYGPDAALWKIWEPDGDGMLCIVSEEGLLGHMDQSGRVIVEPKYRIDTGGPEPCYTFFNGYAVIDDIGDRWPDTERWIILDTAGNEVFSSPYELEDGSQLWLDDMVMEGGLLWYGVDDLYGLMRVRDGRAETLTEPVFEDYLGWMINAVNRQEAVSFSEGLHPVKRNGLYGYIDENGAMVIPPEFQAADRFRDGLAMVLHEGKYAYIDHDGVIVWEEEQP